MLTVSIDSKKNSHNLFVIIYTACAQAGKTPERNRISRAGVYSVYGF